MNAILPFLGFLLASISLPFGATMAHEKGAPQWKEPLATPVLGLSDSGSYLGKPALASNGAQGFIVFWTEQSISQGTVENNVWYSRLSPEDQAPHLPTNLTQYPSRGIDTRSSSASPELGQLEACADDHGYVYVVWEQSWNDEENNRFLDVYVSISSDSGTTFSGPMNLSQVGNAALGAIACDPDGHVVFAFIDFEPTAVHAVFEVSNDHGRSFSLFSLPQGREQNGDPVQSTIALTHGKLFAAWAAGHANDHTGDIFAAYSADDGATWSVPVNLSDHPAFSQDPTIASTKDGRIVAAWDDTRSGVFAVYARTFDPVRQRWSKQTWRLNPLQRGNPSAWPPWITVTASTELWCTWGDPWSLRYSVWRVGTKSRLRLLEAVLVEGFQGAEQRSIASTTDGAVAMAWQGCNPETDCLSPFSRRIYIKLIRRAGDASPL